MSEASLVGLFAATVSFGALLYLAALGELFSEKVGILNLGVEGMMAVGAVTGFMAAMETGNPWVALVVAIAAGALVATVHGLFTVVLGAEQVVSGLSLTILGIGLAAYLAAGLDGVENQIDPGEPNLGNLYEKTLEEISAAGIRILPQSLGESLAALKDDAVVQGGMGVIADEFIDVKTRELQTSEQQVSSWEIDRYLTLF